MPNPGSLVKLRNGQVGLVVSVTPKGEGDLIVPVGYPTNPHKSTELVPGVNYSPYEITEVIHEPELDTGREQDG